MAEQGWVTETPGRVTDLERQLVHLAGELATNRLALSASQIAVCSERGRAEQAESRVRHLQGQNLVLFERYRQECERTDRMAASLRAVQRCWWWRMVLWLRWWGG